jgi:hypothetical protein
MLPNRLPYEFESNGGETIMLDREIVNVHTTPQDLDPWYLADDPNDEYPHLTEEDGHGYATDLPEFVARDLDWISSEDF